MCYVAKGDLCSCAVVQSIRVVYIWLSVDDMILHNDAAWSYRPTKGSADGSALLWLFLYIVANLSDTW